MSWLFDRLCEIAVADQVHVMLCADVDEASLRDDSPDLAEVMARASVVPQLTMLLVPNTAPMPVATRRVLRAVDLEELDAGCVVEAIAVAIRQQRQIPSTGVRLRGPELSLVEIGEGSGSAPAGDVADRPDHRSVLATDVAGRSTELRRIGRRGLGIAIGGVDPEAQVRVESFLGVVSIIDALVTLRSFAFGCESVRPALGRGSRDVRDATGAPPELRRVV